MDSKGSERLSAGCRPGRITSVLATSSFVFVITVPAQVVTIPDPELQAAVRAALAKPAGDITVADMESLTTLYAEGLGTRNFDGLGAAKNLTALTLNGCSSATDPGVTCNFLTDVSLPAGLRSLVTLDLGNNLITNLTLPPDLTNLANLWLDDNLLTDLGFVSGLSGLTNMSLQFNPLGNIATLPGVGGLKVLNLAGSLTNATFPSGLTNLTYVNLGNNELTDLTLPADMSALVDLDVSCNQLTNLAVPACLTNLTTLYLDKNRLSQLRLSTSVTHLTALFLSENRFTNLSFLSGQSKLATLSMSFNSLTNLDLPIGLEMLSNLNLYGNRLADGSFLSNSPMVRILDLGGNQLESLTLPPNLRTLTTLNLRYNPLTNVAIPAGIRTVDPPLIDMKNGGVQVTLFPVLRTPQRAGNGDFNCDLYADAGTFHVFRSTDLRHWTMVGSVTVTTPNYPGALFTENMSSGVDHAFYEVRP